MLRKKQEPPKNSNFFQEVATAGATLAAAVVGMFRPNPAPSEYVQERLEKSEKALKFSQQVLDMTDEPTESQIKGSQP